MQCLPRANLLRFSLHLNFWYLWLLNASVLLHTSVQRKLGGWIFNCQRRNALLILYLKNTVTLGGLLADICKEVGIEKKMNHSLRATGATAMFAAGVPEK